MSLYTYEYVEQNYTELGFSKHQVPEDVFPLLNSFWEDNSENDQTESWSEGTTSVNYWKTPTTMVDIDGSNLPGHKGLAQKVTLAVQEILEDWIGEDLTPCSLYGVRVFHGGAVVAHHVDQLPFVISAIVNVAQDLAFDWPIEMIGHDGMAYNVTLQPGEMLLYEGHSVIHGRPFSLRGLYQANIFLHFEPTDYTIRHEASSTGKLPDKTQLNPEELYKRAFELYDPDRISSFLGKLRDIPPYINKKTQSELRWKGIQEDARPIYTNEYTLKVKIHDDPKEERFHLDLHHFASTGNLEKLMKELEKRPDAVHQKDNNGWMLIHEAARGGHKHILKELVKLKSDINTRTNSGKGATPLWWADQTHGSKHPATKYLQKLGAQKIGPAM